MLKTCAKESNEVVGQSEEGLRCQDSKCMCKKIESRGDGADRCVSATIKEAVVPLTQSGGGRNRAGVRAGKQVTAAEEGGVSAGPNWAAAGG